MIKKSLSHRKFFKAIYWLFITNSPIVIFLVYFKTFLFAKILFNKKDSKKITNKNFSTDWFAGNIPYWESIFDRFQMSNRNLNCLEIGSWEGRSSLFILESLPNSKIICVDTWGGADEHKGLDSLKNIEENFDKNLLAYQGRFNKWKGTSFSFFNQLESQVKFDLIYIDGSHYVDDVLLDAINAFAHLSVGGILIFDDFFWNFYNDSKLNPALAINSFISLKRNYLKVDMVYSQVVVTRVADEARMHH
jgi:predicted O-methyltransferase YrrM